jgi:hypothetical protein
VDVWDYFDRREGECKECSLGLDVAFPLYCAEAEGSVGKSGIFYGRLILGERTYVSVFEVLGAHGSTIRRERYSYYLVIDDREVWGYDLDPEHNPATHRHEGTSHKRYPASSITFKEMAKLAWQTAGAHEALHPLPQ